MILIIEDRFERQFRLLNQAGIDLNEYDFLENATKERYEEIYDALKEESFDFLRYEFIISHKSAFKDDNALMINRLKRGCEQNGIPLVFFSGNQSATYHDRDSNYAEMLSILLYSQNLKLFLEDRKITNKPNMDILLYGEKWLLNIALNLLQEINIFIEKSEDDRIFYKRFEMRFLDSLEFLKEHDICLEIPSIEEKFTDKKTLTKVTDSLKDNIQRMIDE